MKKLILLLIFLILPVCMAIDISVKSPSEVKKGDIFNLEVYAKNVSNCSGLECDIYVPDNFIIVGVSSCEVGAKYNLTINFNNSATIQYLFLPNTKNEDFKVGIFKIKALKEGNSSILLKAVASDNNGNAIYIPEKTIMIKVYSNSNKVSEKNKEYNLSPVFIILLAIILIGIIAYIYKKRTK